MKRYGHLWKTLASFENLYFAFQKAIKGKRLKEDVSFFIFHAERELLKLREQLQQKTYCPDEYRTFFIYDRKKRLISASHFRDRVVHHALCNVIEPIFEGGFIYDLYSNRAGKGIHMAVRRARHFARRYPFVLKCDIKKYFPSIDHGILKDTIRRKIKCPETLWLIDLIIDKSNPQEKVLDYYPGDNLFTPAERPKGLPIGNQTSQFFSNVYLNPMDHFIKEVLKVKGYARYVDDFLLFGNSKKELWSWKERVQQFLADFRLRYKPNGVTLYRVETGFPFLGYRVLPHAILVNRDAVLRFRRKVRHMRRLRMEKKIGLDRIKSFVFGSMGHFKQADSDNFRRKLMGETWF